MDPIQLTVSGPRATLLWFYGARAAILSTSVAARSLMGQKGGGMPRLDPFVLVDLCQGLTPFRPGRVSR
jgi:hypothetical protein